MEIILPAEVDFPRMELEIPQTRNDLKLSDTRAIK